MLSSNRLKELNVNVFTHLKNLKRLDLSDNLLNNLDSDIFAGLSNLIELNLSKNSLAFNNLSIEQNPIKFDYLPNLISLNLAGNLMYNLTSFNSPFIKNEQANDELDQPAYLQLKSASSMFNDQNAQYTIYPKFLHQLNGRRPFYLNRKQSANQPVAERRTNLKKWGNLRELDLSSTQLNLIENDAFSSLNQLQILKIRGNRMIVSILF